MTEGRGKNVLERAWGRVSLLDEGGDMRTGGVMKWLRLVVVAALLVTLGTPAGVAGARAFTLRQGNVAANQEKLDAGCNTASLKGTYGFSGQGLLPGGAPMAWVGVFTFDGAGRFSGYHDENIDGSVGSSTEAGDYSVGTDCRGVTHWTNHRHTNLPGDFTHTFKFVVVDGGKEVWLLGVDTSHPNVDRSKGPQADFVYWSSLKRM